MPNPAVRCSLRRSIPIGLDWLKTAGRSGRSPAPPSQRARNILLPATMARTAILVVLLALLSAVPVKGGVSFTSGGKTIFATPDEDEIREDKGIMVVNSNNFKRMVKENTVRARSYRHTRL